MTRYRGRGAYFANERERHPEARALRLTFAQAVRVTRWLAVEHGFTLREVKKLPAKRGTAFGKHQRRGAVHVIWYRPVRYREGPKDGVTLLTVAHEVAHAIDADQRPRAKRRHCNAHRDLVADVLTTARACAYTRLEVA